MISSFCDTIIKSYYHEDPLATCRTVTFQVTDDCCLNCSYCYQIHKGHHFMSNDVIKAGIDLLFKMYDENKENAFINHHTKGLVIEFIGGEPFLNIDTIMYGSQYFIDECIKRNHIWLTNFRFSFSSNGMLYFEPKVQEYINKFLHFINLTITIDGPQELHDTCRKDLQGNGSFNKAIAAYDDWIKKDHQPSAKITIAPENLPYINTIFDFFIERKCSIINANPIYEHEWTIQEAQLYYKQLKQLADTLLNFPHVQTSLFNELHHRPLLSSENGNWCGGTGVMLAFDPNGDAYPCIRYMSSSLGNSRPPLIIGDIHGVYQDENLPLYNELREVTRYSQSTSECINCHIASGCSWCSAWNYQKYGTFNKRDTNICWMHRAQALANVYYYNSYYKKNNINKHFPMYLNRDIATQLISDKEYDDLLLLSFN